MGDVSWDTHKQGAPIAVSAAGGRDQEACGSYGEAGGVHVQAGHQYLNVAAAELEGVAVGGVDMGERASSRDDKHAVVACEEHGVTGSGEQGVKSGAVVPGWGTSASSKASKSPGAAGEPSGGDPVGSGVTEEAMQQLGPRAALKVAVLLGKQGDCLMQVGQPQEAAGKYAASLWVSRRVVQDPSVVQEVDDVTAITLGKLGDLRLSEGDVKGASYAFRQMAEVREASLHREELGDDPQLIYKLIVALTKWWHAEEEIDTKEVLYSRVEKMVRRIEEAPCPESLVHKVSAVRQILCGSGA